MPVYNNQFLSILNYLSSGIPILDLSQGFFQGDGGPPSGKNFVNPPPDTCPRFWTKACPPQPRFVPENLRNLNTFLCQIWLLLSSKVP